MGVLSGDLVRVLFCQQFDILADGVRGALDMDAVYAAMGMERR